ncbi:MAG: ComF family protein [Vogesella sp.]|nr:ComF family protein [Vogesella sp.]
MLSNLCRYIIDSCPLFEQHCQLCGQRATRHGLCEPCRQQLPRRQGHRCPICQAPAASAQAPCGDCQGRHPAFSHLYSAYDYDYPLEGLITRCKYAPSPALQGMLASLMPQALLHAQSGAGYRLPDLVVPVPLAAARLRERGFNLPDALARALADTMRVRFDDQLCWRKRNTDSQAALNRRARLRNVRDAFGVKRRCDGLYIAIVDDVASTGATLHSLAKTLRKSGAKQVDAWVLARAIARQA